MNSQPSTETPQQTSRRTWIIVTVVLLILIAVVVNLRFLSGEDDWICKDGQWIQHGHPTAPRPTTPCR